MPLWFSRKERLNAYLPHFSRLFLWADFKSYLVESERKNLLSGILEENSAYSKMFERKINRLNLVESHVTHISLLMHIEILLNTHRQTNYIYIYIMRITKIQSQRHSLIVFCQWSLDQMFPVCGVFLHIQLCVTWWEGWSSFWGILIRTV